MAKYEVKGKTTKIIATSRCAVKIKDNYYTTELSAERVLPESDDVDLNKEYEDLFNSINDEVDRQMTDIINTFARK
jgi:hypothetical protein